MCRNYQTTKSAIYCYNSLQPPNATSDFFDHLEKLIKQIDDEDKEMYLLGDLNCHMLKKEALQNT